MQHRRNVDALFRLQVCHIQLCQFQMRRAINHDATNTGGVHYWNFTANEFSWLGDVLEHVHILLVFRQCLVALKPHTAPNLLIHPPRTPVRRKQMDLAHVFERQAFVTSRSQYQDMHFV
jgi:hypothetical protein